MPTNQTPSVYYERADTVAPAISAIRTDIAGFVGIAERGPVGIPIPVESWRQFTAHFGGFIPAAYLAYTVRAFFENGGRRCWIVRVAAGEPLGSPRAANLVVQDAAGKNVWKITASSPGAWGNGLSVILRETRRLQTFTETGKNAANASKVRSIGGFDRGTHVRLSQPGFPDDWKVVSNVNVQERLINWAGEKEESRPCYAGPMTGFDPNDPITVESVEYSLFVAEKGRTIAVYEGLSLVPEHPRYGPKILAQTNISKDHAQRGMIPSAPQPVIIEELRSLDELKKSPSAACTSIDMGVRATLVKIIGPTRIEIASPARVEAGSILELRDPRQNTVIGQPLRVEHIETGTNMTIVLQGSGLALEQNNKGNTAIALNKPLSVRVVNRDFLHAKLSDGSDGLRLLRADDFIGEEVSPMDGEEEARGKLRGIRALNAVDEIAIVAVPDIHIRPKPLPITSPRTPCKPDICLYPDYVALAEPSKPEEPELPPVFSEHDIYRVQAALVHHCEEGRDRIAILEPPQSVATNDLSGVAAVQAWRSRFDSKYAALYHPWLRVVDPLHSVPSLLRAIPPCGHVAGQYARNDFELGVHKAPANVAMEWAHGVTVALNDEIHGILNNAGINVLRALPGRGLRILGARTVSSDPDWRYVNVRRLMMMIEKAIDHATQWAAFEPNNLYTRAKMTLSLTGFLDALWQQGALVGAERKEAFFVKCDDENNPPRERDNGRLLAEIGVAPSKPWEFIVIRIGRAGNELEMREYSLSKGGM